MDLKAFAEQLEQTYVQDCATLHQDAPWFSHFSIQGTERQFTYKIGPARQNRLRILDWRHPLAKGFYDCEAGDEFDLNHYQTGVAGHRLQAISGIIQHQATVQHKGRALVQIDVRQADETHLIEKTEQGFHVVQESVTPFRAVDGLPDIRALLTPAQYRLISTHPNNPVIIQGQAGSGKTTVALYRVSWLMSAEANASPVDPNNVLIVMFNKALQSFVAGTLAPLGLSSAKVVTFHGWALQEVRRAYQGNIELCTDRFDGHKIASALKKQIGLLSALDAFVEQQTTRLCTWVETKLKPYHADDWVTRLRHSEQPIVQRLITLRTTALTRRNRASGKDKDRLEQIRLLLIKAIKRMTLYKEELLNFFTDTALLKQHLPLASDADLHALSQYQQALQGKDRTSRRPGPYIGFEDLALILRLMQLKHGGLPNKDQEDAVNLYDHLVIDEAQDFGALEMTVLLAAVRTRAGVTIVGDTHQKIIPEADFMGWESLAEQLGIEGATVSKLEVAHRSTKPIMDLACHIIQETSSGGRPGSKPKLTIVRHTEEKIAALVATLAHLQHTMPQAHIGIICRHASETQPLLKQLEPEACCASARLGHNKHFEFTPGITVTNLRQIKGLEFDVIILLDPSEANYPNTTQGQKYLYTAITRAKEYVYLIAACDPAVLLRQAIDQDLLEVDSQLAVLPIVFSEEDDEPL